MTTIRLVTTIFKCLNMETGHHVGQSHQHLDVFSRVLPLYFFDFFTKFAMGRLVSIAHSGTSYENL